MGIYEEFSMVISLMKMEAIDQFAFLKNQTAKRRKIRKYFAFETGYGEGFYAAILVWCRKINRLNYNGVIEIKSG